MELGARLRQARLEAGLSQRQLCGDVITRNMLSQIENGSARPSMDTLRYLAARLGKPMGYFLEEQAVLSPNAAVMERARAAQGKAVLEALEDYREPDGLFDRERWLLEALICLELAGQALDEGRKGLAGTLLTRAEKAGARTPYYTPELERRRQLLCFEGGFLSRLPADEQALLLQARSLLVEGEPSRCGHLLEAMESRDENWHFLRAEVYFAAEQYALAAEHYRQAENFAPDQVYARLEHCYRELEDYKMAYLYACKQRSDK